MSSQGIVFSTGIPTLDGKFGKNGIHIGSWVGLVGEPGSMKTLTCIKMVGEWLENPDHEGYCAVYVTTETNSNAILKHFSGFGYDLTPYIENKQFIIVDAFSRDKLLDNKYAAVEVSRMVEEQLRNFKVFKDTYNAKILLVIDSLAPLWQIMPSMSRTMFSTLSRKLRNAVDLCIVTLQLSIGTDRGFGFGAEHGIDVMVRMGSYFKDGERNWIHVSKCRGDTCDKRLFDYHVNGNLDLVVDEEIKVNGRFKDVYEAIESMKYSSNREIQAERNELIKEQNKLLQSIVDKLVAIKSS